MPTNPKTGITRRGFIQLGSGAALAVGVLGSAAGTETSTASAGKIALEEHFDFAATASASYAAPGSPEFQRQIQNLGSGRIAEMDRGGVELCILSLVGPGIQAITSARQAAEWRGRRTIIWLKTSRRIPNVLGDSPHCHCRILTVPLRN